MSNNISRRQFVKTAAAAGVALAWSESLAQKSKDRPNVIMVMVDDMGYQDLGSYGHPSIKTPVLDKLSAGGIRLTSFYAGATICTPSRMALLTGAYPTRLGWTKGVVGYLMGAGDGLNPKALTIAEIFKSEAYATAISGKWHLGNQPDTRPHKQGFDVAYYIDKSNNQTKKVWRKDEIIEQKFDNRLLTEQFTTEAIKFIKDKKDKPFFLYLPYSAPHFPVQAHPKWKGKSAYGVYGDVIEELDFRMGEILSALKDLKIDKKTIFVFFSDNGPNPREKSGSIPYRGGKWSVLEGGTRVPCIVNFPGVIPPGQKSNEMIAAIDLLPTLCHACGIDWKSKSNDMPKIDGVNVWATLLGKKGDHPRKELLYWRGKDGSPQAIRIGDWKLFFDRRYALEGAGTARKTPAQAAKIEKYISALKKDEKNPPMLVNLKDDLGETVDLSEKYPGKVKAMQARADKLFAEMQSGTILPIAKPVKKK
ncbi:MAG: sulfatase-like hydrolase/transferase [bacterium]|nr:sulfatase-like hydrolase/transferase [bacterium]